MFCAQIVVPVIFLTEKARAGERRRNTPDDQLLHPSVIGGDHIPPIAFALGEDAVRFQHQLASLSLGGAEKSKDFFYIH
jgi:hypothetical protein